MDRKKASEKEVVIEEAQVIEETPVTEEIQETKEPELSEEEQQKRTESFLRGFIASRYRTTLEDIFQYMKSRKLTLEEVVQEVNEKRSWLTTSRRSFVTGLKIDFIDQLLLDKYGDHYRASNPVEESAGRSKVDSEQTAYVSGFSDGPVDQENAGSGAQSDKIS